MSVRLAETGPATLDTVVVTQLVIANLYTPGGALPQTCQDCSCSAYSHD